MESIDGIQKKMIGFDKKIQPEYITKVSVEEVDGKQIIVIWVPTGAQRPYSVPESVTTKGSTYKFYIRSKASTIQAKGLLLDKVRELANRVPFDERGNGEASIDDISDILVYEHLKTVKSKLVEDFRKKPLIEILDRMNLLEGPTENRKIKNVALMMFCENPEKFFPYSQVEIVVFPEGREANPDVMYEIPPIKGPVPRMIKETLSYLRTNVIKQKIEKQDNKEESKKTFNYPFRACEEIIGNSLYHRNYEEREPVEITIEPDHIDILSHSGPDPSLSIEAIKKAQVLKTRKYRNRRLGDFLKELDLTEGRATGYPTAQKALKENGSEPLINDTDENRTYFLVTIPCHKDMINYEEKNDDSNIINYNEFTRIKNLLVSGLISEDLQVLNIDIQQNEGQINQLVSVISETYFQVWNRASVELDVLLSGFLKIFWHLKNTTSLSLSELLKISGLKTVYIFKRNFLFPSISAGYIELVNPDKPTSSKQAYRLTKKGRELFKT